MLQVNAGHEIRRVLEKLPSAAYLCDVRGLITYFNPRAVELWGREPKLNDTQDRYCGSFKLFSPDGAPIPHDQCWMALTLRENREFQGEEIVIERPDGDRFTALAYARPLYDESGSMSGAVNVLVDISDRMQAHEAKTRLAAIIDSSDDAIISKTLDGRILSWNTGAERLFGYTAEEAIGQSIMLIIPPERSDEEATVLGRLRNGERIDHYETVRRAKDGRRVHISLTVSPIRDVGGRLIGASKVARDVTLQKQALEALRDADRAKDEFLAMLAHELRNPLAPIRNAVEILGAQSPPSPESRWALGVIDRQTKQMVRLVDDLLDVSRIWRKKLSLRTDQVKLEDVLRAAVEASQPLIDEAEHVLTVAATPRAVYLDADPVRLAQAITNLLNNAAKYTERRGQIWLIAEQQGSEAVVTVRDTGVGIPTEMLPGLFEMFVQIDRTLERSQGGLGIGLTLVKEIVELHGGTVEARSEGRGKGSEFIVRLPVAEKRSRPPRTSRKFERTASAAARRILVVDDNLDLAKSLAMLLESMGNEVRTAHDGPEAVQVASEFRPHAVALDVGLPIMNGFDVAKQLRQQPWGKQMILVAVTGWGQEQDRQRALEAGFDHHMVKPMDAASFLKVLDASGG